MSHILVAEDSPFQARFIRGLLTSAGHEVELAEDGIAAFDILRRLNFDAVVTDLVMPRMNGLELVETVRRELPGLPVLLITAHGSEAIAAQALQAGAASYVPKSQLETDLVTTLGNVLMVAGTDPANQRLLSCLEGVDLRFSLGNDASVITPLVNEVQRVMAQAGLCDRTSLVRIGVALHEALVNAMEHGNLEADSELRQDDERVYRRVIEDRRNQSPYCDRRVHFRGVFGLSEAIFTVRDEGPGFTVSDLPDPNDPANLERIGGRGLLLIRTFMDEVYHNPMGNEMTLVKRSPAARQARSKSASQAPAVACA